MAEGRRLGALRVLATWKRFRPEGRRAAVHSTLRTVSLPLSRLLRLVPIDGDVLEVGCGHGVVSQALADRGQRGTVVGVDVDGHKIAVAQAISRRDPTARRPNFQVVDPGWEQLSGRFDVVVVVDVLYLLGEARAPAAIERLSELVAPGGVLVVKEMSRSPRWKCWVDRIQESFSVRMLRITAGTHVAPLSVEAIADRLETLGWCTTLHRLDRNYPHPHAVVVGRAH